MRMAFEQLVENVLALSDDDWQLPMGELAARWGEPVGRAADAVIAAKMLRQGTLTCTYLVDESCD